MKRVAAVVGVAWCLDARPAWACGQCMDQQAWFQVPFAPSWLMVFVGWVLATTVIRQALRWRPADVNQAVPSGRALFHAFLGLAVAFFGLSMFTMGSVVAPALLVGGGGLLVALVHGVRAVRRGGGWPARAFISVTLAALVSAGVMVPIKYQEAASPEVLVHALSYPGGPVYDRALPRVLALGPVATPFLVKRVNALVADEGGHRRSTLGVHVYALARVCESTERDFLADLATRAVLSRTGPLPGGDGRILAADAMCSGGAAVPRLVDALNRPAPATADGTPDPRRVAIVVALVRTASLAGVERALDEVKLLSAAADARMQDGLSIMATLALRVLLEGTSRQELLDLPVFRTGAMDGVQPGSTRAVFMRPIHEEEAARDALAPHGADLGAAAARARERWRTVLASR